MFKRSFFKRSFGEEKPSFSLDSKNPLYNKTPKTWKQYLLGTKQAPVQWDTAPLTTTSRNYRKKGLPRLVQMARVAKDKMSEELKTTSKNSLEVVQGFVDALFACYELYTSVSSSFDSTDYKQEWFKYLKERRYKWNEKLVSIRNLFDSQLDDIYKAKIAAILKDVRWSETRKISINKEDEEVSVNKEDEKVSMNEDEEEYYKVGGDRQLNRRHTRRSRKQRLNRRLNRRLTRGKGSSRPRGRK